ncbi:GTP-binding protein [Planotetraspora kaengkrachanensis]|uniref:GTP-binding protein n=1 Tax=Planotetraspora kaengkrachanensis TaxID=575193 RepID=UPI001941D733|nr:GTP-binding protein [Planotetraspora kaengkrachanensis]
MTADQAPDPVETTGAAALPVAIVTGFLGSGKTTFVRGLLDAGGGGRIARTPSERLATAWLRPRLISWFRGARTCSRRSARDAGSRPDHRRRHRYTNPPHS